ncbi:MAG: DUF4031 domain-containing protein [Solirubrobacterales bacterium]|nr:DUF4031 domain-containing protein [Solirubrobacterales bacterium]
MKALRLTVYVDNAFAIGDWGRWTGGGHLQADTPEELHEFAGRIGLRREWFQAKPGRPENDHYDLTRQGREAPSNSGPSTRTEPPVHAGAGRPAGSVASEAPRRSRTVGEGPRGPWSVSHPAGASMSRA